MSESKEYWNQQLEQGNIKIAEDVIASIAALAVADVDGVYAISSSGLGSDIAEFFGKKSSFKGVKTHLNDDSIDIDVFVVVTYGFPVCDVAQNIQTKVSNAIADMAGVRVSSVNVNIMGIVFPEETEQTSDSEQNTAE